MVCLIIDLFRNTCWVSAKHQASPKAAGTKRDLPLGTNKQEHNEP
jgi:hypothetical protein